jgi:hypothetical protein
MGIPGHIIVPNEYFLCDNCEDKHLDYHDIYNDMGQRIDKKDK